MFRRIWMPGILVCAVAVSGCGVLQRDVAQVQSTAQSAAADEQRAGTPEQGAAGEAQNAASAQGVAGEQRNPSSGEGNAGGAGTVDTTTAIAKATYNAPFAPDATVEVAVHGLNRRGRLLDLVFSLTPRVPGGDQSDQRINPYRILGRQSLNVTLIDTVNLKRHLVVKDSRGRELKPDDVWTNTLIGRQLVLTYTFAAPPEDVTKMDVHIANWPPFTDVPVES